MGGLPLHPLVVHAVVVLLPLSALALILLVFVRKWRRHYAWLAVAGAVAGTLAAVAAVITGDVFAESVGMPDRHAALGLILMWVAIPLSISAVVWWSLERRSREKEKEPNSVRVVGIVVAALAAATLVMTVLVGHSGAEAAWGWTEAGPSPADGAAEVEGEVVENEVEKPADSSTGGDEPAAVEGVYTAAEVAEHNSAASCWASVNGAVYDLTEWISQHPGGSARIERLCGTDASSQSTAQHSGSAEALKELEGLKIGDLG